MTFFVFSKLQKISTGYPFFKIGFPSKICTKNVKLNIWNFHLTWQSTNWLGVYQAHFFPLFEPTDFLLIAFCGFGFLFFSFKVTSFFAFGFSFFYPALAFFFDFVFTYPFCCFTTEFIKMSTLKRHFQNFLCMEKTKKVMHLPLIIQML